MSCRPRVRTTIVAMRRSPSARAETRRGVPSEAHGRAAMPEVQVSEVQRTRESSAASSSYGMVGASPPMIDVYRIIGRVGRTTCTVLVQGETGPGKARIARGAHTAGGRGDRPFVTVDCGALAEGVLESELFGHVKGAFTGAVCDKRGLFEAATGGTCFLDE